MAMRDAARLVFTIALIAPVGAHALDNDPALRGFGRFTRGAGVNPGTLIIDQAGFEDYARDLGVALAPSIRSLVPTRFTVPEQVVWVSGFKSGKAICKR